MTRIPVSLLLGWACSGNTDDTAAEGACTPVPTYVDADGDGFGDPFRVERHCDPPAGFSANSDDCDDSDPDQRPEQSWFRDADGDGFGDDAVTTTACLRPVGYGLAGSDCDDADATRFPGAVWYSDLDGDGFGDVSAERDACGDVTGAVPDATDCDDDSWLVHPDAEEVCNLIDDDCDGLTDDADEDIDVLTQQRMFVDSDGDGYGTDEVLGDYCPGLEGGAAVSGDCDDTDPRVHPSRLDFQDDLDSNCDGVSGSMDVTLATAGWSGFVSGGFSRSVVTKDIDGDGRYELMVGAFTAGDDDAGAVGFIPGTVEVGDGSSWADEAVAPVWTGELADGLLGQGLNFAGDWNGDGVEDFIVGAPEANDNAGAVYVLSTDSGGGSVEGALLSVESPDADAYFGFETAALGDINGDGRDDVLVSARRDSRVGTNRGSVAFYAGGEPAESVVLHDGFSNGDQFGFAMAVADWDGDGVDEVAVGAPYGDGLVSNGGEVYLFSVEDWTAPVGEDDALVRFDGPDLSARAGQALRAVGDVDGDGHGDLLVGAPGYRDSEGGEGGSAFLVRGSGTGWESTDLSDAHWRFLESGIDQTAARYLSAAGDIDGDGRQDVLMSAHKWDTDEDIQAGRVYGVLGSRPSGTWRMPEDVDLLIHGTGRYGYLGRGMAPAGDVDGDGLDDFWVGSSGARTLFLLDGAQTPLP